MKEAWNVGWSEDWDLLKSAELVIEDKGLNVK
jgi:hypothetical protein